MVAPAMPIAAVRAAKITRSIQFVQSPMDQQRDCCRDQWWSSQMPRIDSEKAAGESGRLFPQRGYMHHAQPHGPPTCRIFPRRNQRLSHLRHPGNARGKMPTGHPRHSHAGGVSLIGHVSRANEGEYRSSAREAAIRGDGRNLGDGGRRRPALR